MLQLWTRVVLGAIAMKGYSAFPKAPALPELHHQFSVISRTLIWWEESYPFAKMQLVYSTAQADWEKIATGFKLSKAELKKTDKQATP